MEKKISVMIVDDEYIVREDLKTLVDWEYLGFRIACEAINGYQGVELFRRYRPQLVITDIKMPVMNGLEMAEKILGIDPAVCFIFLTAYDEFDFARNAMSMGINHYLLKHEIDPEGLTELLGQDRRGGKKSLETNRRADQRLAFRHFFSGRGKGHGVFRQNARHAFLYLVSRKGRRNFRGFARGGLSADGFCQHRTAYGRERCFFVSL